MGLSVLLLATSGILHEARAFRTSNLNGKVEWVLKFFFHSLIVVGVALTATGMSRLQNHEQPMDKNLNMAKAGIAMLAACWGGLSGLAGSSFIARPSGSNVRAGTVLLASVCLSLLLIGVRVFYTLAAVSTQKASLNPVTGSLAVRVVLGFLTELVAALVYVSAGFVAQGLAQREGEGKDYTMVAGRGASEDRLQQEVV
ncbi:hypothetical protein PHISP_03666 [Aspergillus sp. HF37]|nr:hypothetical protein PHISP_03666 [Aspergillus sp. HF37]